MKKIFSLFRFTLIFLFLILIGFQTNYSSEINPGEINKSVMCLNKSSESYAIYLPSDYSAETKWPVIIAFEPAARAVIPVGLFEKAAEKYGYIVVCSNNSQNGPWKDVLISMRSVWTDLNKRFSINSKRVYTTGFSGGARAAALFGTIIGIHPAGIIGCGAGLPSKLPPEKIKNSFYYGIIGLEDFNYKEFQRLVPQFDKADIRYCIDYIQGVHKWPPEDVLTRAVEWMEIDAIRRGTDKMNRDQMESIFFNSWKYGVSLYESDLYYYGVQYLDRIVKHFRGVLPESLNSGKTTLDELEKKIRSQKVSGKSYKKFREEEDIRIKKEYQFISIFKSTFIRIESRQKSRLGLQSVLNDLKIPFLKSERKNKRRIYDGYMATRLLYEIAIKANRISSDFLKKRDKKMSILFAQIAAETETRSIMDNYQLAAVYAVFGNKKKCIKIIKLLLNDVKNLLDYIEKDPNFNEMLKDPDFMKIFIERTNK